MLLKEAIEILSNHGVKPKNTTWGDYLEAVKLGVEALKFYEELRRTQGVRIAFRLPGETVEAVSPESFVNTHKTEWGDKLWRR